MFAKLSGELRNQIYEHLLSEVTVHGIPLRYSSSEKACTNPAFQLRAFAQSCRLFRDELDPLLRSRVTFSIELHHLQRYLDVFHPAVDPSNPLRRPGGKIILEEAYNRNELSHVDILRLTRTILESPDLEVSFERQHNEASDIYKSGSFVIQGLLQHYMNWKHLGEQLTAIGLVGIYLHTRGRDLLYRNNPKPHSPCRITVYLDFDGNVDASSGPSLFTDNRAHLVTKWIFQSGMVASWLFCSFVAIECAKTNGDGVHYWEIHADLLVQNYQGLKYAFKSAGDGDADAVLCSHTIETETCRKAGFADVGNTRFPTYKPLPSATPLRDESFQVFEFGYESAPPWVKREVWSVPEDAEMLEASEAKAKEKNKGVNFSLRVSRTLKNITMSLSGSGKRSNA